MKKIAIQRTVENYKTVNRIMNDITGRTGGMMYDGEVGYIHSEEVDEHGSFNHMKRDIHQGYREVSLEEFISIMTEGSTGEPSYEIN